VPVYRIREQTTKGSEWSHWQCSELWPRDTLQSPVFFVLPNFSSPFTPAPCDWPREAFCNDATNRRPQATVRCVDTVGGIIRLSQGKMYSGTSDGI